ncbi:hypothetical protein ACQUZP_09185, partial [Streptococcus pyogenes]
MGGVAGALGGTSGTEDSGGLTGALSGSSSSGFGGQGGVVNNFGGKGVGVNAGIAKAGVGLTKKGL